MWSAIIGASLSEPHIIMSTVGKSTVVDGRRRPTSDDVSSACDDVTQEQYGRGSTSASYEWAGLYCAQ